VDLSSLSKIFSEFFLARTDCEEIDDDKLGASCCERRVPLCRACDDLDFAVIRHVCMCVCDQLELPFALFWRSFFFSFFFFPPFFSVCEWDVLRRRANTHKMGEITQKDRQSLAEWVSPLCTLFIVFSLPSFSHTALPPQKLLDTIGRGSFGVVVRVSTQPPLLPSGVNVCVHVTHSLTRALSGTQQHKRVLCCDQKAERAEGADGRADD
jgi:hypothetical protein